MKEELILDLFDIGAVKFGEFKLKSGMMSPIYIDLRILVSYPRILKEIASLMIKKMNALDYDLVAGIPYTAIPIATAISLKNEIPMIYARKEKKDYGTKKLIEGIYKKGDVCVVVDDLITTGESKFETAEPFEAEGIVIKDFIVLVDREQGGDKKLAERGYKLHSVAKISEILDTLLTFKKITREEYDKATEFIKVHKVA
ncbi:MAG: hypothetical protein UU65_C0002G0261 [candidate division CPR2 bacterium GW2011_GWC1_41_48]|uniref:Orotate phosphoribosyltransferase n=1 Tax=candidate division CPR2 bacterium GW2011_GWC1_41_48 TaxID=1618344 RepID=A0A0G0Z8T4_UNCC2|nr:MAG: hypothetical protein UT47_C0002G0043 [candidate division CPR2 bacterium GW2011_GWC2_39_35]KKR28986.1 MAG: hypothetical protein UT60_C0008G0029 [candidate division CPR2 bacterium GW2011_GWD2_39_7]KKR29262.1 MAG: hypothetical protein UT59_C0010G0014 [candidate division CPR2 bacterium GW2011_GWD1_39_7]KKS09483.1 MAG: hypothetical protein UU65_C0002G0261 [candidate division CPR2 bacterium GW2011_GWC1_41_48]OGB62191.1 MAG: orotate phosphoribosyltransferase [candidate division CPR2 bacterium 